MFFIDKIEKIKPLIFLLVSVLFISTLLPISYYAPLSQTSENFNNNNTSGLISFKLQKETIFFNLTIISLNSAFFTNQSNAFQFIIFINHTKQYEQNYTLSNIQHNTKPLYFIGNFTLKGSLIYLLNIQLQTTIYLLNTSSPPQNLNELITINSAIGKINFSLYETWFFITLLGGLIILTTDLLFLQKKHNISLLRLIGNFIRQSYSLYNSFLDKLDTNSFVILLLTPIMLFAIILTQIYINYFSSSSHYSLILYNSKINFVILIYCYAIITLYSPVLFNAIYDQFHNSKLDKKGRIREDFIFIPIFVLLYVFILVVTTIFPYIEIRLFLILFSLIINICIYYVSFVHHQSRNSYKINKWRNIIYASSFRLFTLLLLYFLMEFIFFAHNSISPFLLLY